MNKKRAILYRMVTERMAKFVDIDNEHISNQQAKLVLARSFKIPGFLQATVMHELVEDWHLLERVNPKMFKINLVGGLFGDNGKCQS